MKHVITAVLLGIGVFTTPVMAQTDAKAKSILDAVSKKVGSLKSLKSNFVLKLVGSNGKVRQTNKGSFIMKGQKYRVTLPSQEIICDGRTVWTYMKDAKEVQVSNYNPEEQSISPTKLFTGFYDKEYNYRFTGNRKVGGKDAQIVELVPKNKAKQFSRVELAVDKANTIVGGNVFEKNGNQYVYEVSGFTPNAAVTDGQFTFDTKKYPGVEVVDLR